MPGFSRDLNEICTPLRFYPALSGNSISTFRVNLLVPFSRVTVDMELPLYAAKSQKSTDLTSKRLKRSIPREFKWDSWRAKQQVSSWFLCYCHSLRGPKFICHHAISLAREHIAKWCSSSSLHQHVTEREKNRASNISVFSHSSDFHENLTRRRRL
jgi:hypothetical protein